MYVMLVYENIIKKTGKHNESAKNARSWPRSCALGICGAHRIRLSVILDQSQQPCGARFEDLTGLKSENVTQVKCPDFISPGHCTIAKQRHGPAQ
jgi:hypothetical protein